MCASSKPDLASTIAALQDRAMVAGIVAGQLGEQLAHVVAEIEMVDDELAGGTGWRSGSALKPHPPPGAHASTLRPLPDAVRERREQHRRAFLRARRAQLESMRADAARQADALRSERARVLLRVNEPERRSALTVVRTPDAMFPDSPAANV